MALASENISKRLKQLSDRLINITKGNRSIRLLRKTKQRCFDLAELAPLNPRTCGVVLDNILAEKSADLLTYKDCPIDPREARYELLIDEKDELEEQETPEFKKVKLFRKLFSNLTQLSRFASAVEAETGAEDLYLGYPWLCGVCDDTEGTYLQAPLMLFPVRLRLESSPRLKWVVEPRDGAEPIFNGALAMALKLYHNAELDETFFEDALSAVRREAEDPGLTELVGWFQDRFIKLGMRMSDPSKEIAPLQEFKAANVPNNTQGFTIRSHAVIGYFPQTESSLKRDYDELMEASQRGQLGDLLSQLMDSAAPGAAGNGDAKYTMDETPEQNTCWIVESDASQERAMLRSQAEKCLVVHGPPGTGKSQVICNLIADALEKGQRVLVCCQKRAALDVVYQRLEACGLAKHIALVHDASNDRQHFYKHVANALEPVPTERGGLKAQADSLAASIDESTKLLRRIAEDLHRERRCGHSAHELYSLMLKASADPDPELLPLARHFDRRVLDRFLERLKKLQALHAQLNERAQAWSDRKSFARLAHTDRAKILQLLNSLKQTCETAIQAIAPFQGKTPAGPAVARNLDSLVTLSTMFAGKRDPDMSLANSLMDSSTLGKTRAACEALNRLVPAAKNLPEPPSAELIGGTLEVAAAIENYCRKRKSWLAFLSKEFRAARAKSRAYLAQNGVEDTLANGEEQAKLIRSMHTWMRMRAAVEGTPLAPFLQATSNASDVEAAGKQFTQVFELMTTFNRLRGTVESLLTPAVGSSIQAVSSTAAQLANWGSAYKSVAAAIEALTPFLGEKAIAVLVEKAGSDPQALLGLSTRLRDGLDDFNTFQAIDDLVDGLSDLEARAFRHTRKKGPKVDWGRHVEDAMVHGWLAEVELESRDLRRVSTGEANELRVRFREELKRRRDLNQKRLALTLDRRANSVRFDPERAVDGRSNAEKPWKDLKHQVNKQRRLWTLRKLVRELRWPLLEVMPCWLVSPETLSAAFPLESGLFDLAIFDEASQLAVQFGVPAIHRAKRVVVAGDEQQLRPFDLFSSVDVSEDDEQQETEDEEPDRAATEAESILTLAKARFPEEMLNCHYRSRYEELIEFSNQGFYQGRLLTVPPVDAIGAVPIEWKKIEGIWEKRRNTKEALAVGDLLFELLKANGDHKTIGVITFNSTQQTEILDQIDRRKSEDPAFSALISKAENPESGNKDAALFVKNIENVQGDERDIIIFSIGYAPDPTGRVYSRFGTLNKEGGDNRLNVAISRAKEKVYLLSSVEPDQLSVSTSRNRGPRLLKSYLEYAKAISSKAQEEAQAILRGVNPSMDVGGKKTGTFDSPLEVEVFEELTRRNFTVRPQIGVSGYRIDLGVVDPDDASRYLLGIECDGATYHRATCVRERDAYRQRFLETRGWKIHRIWSRNWWQNREEEIRKVLDAISKVRKS